MTLSYETPRVVFKTRYVGQRTQKYKSFAVYLDSPEWSTLMSAAVCHANVFNFAEDLIDWMAKQFMCHLLIL